MKRIRLRVAADATGISIVDRWVGANTNAPDFGTFSKPTTRSRRYERQMRITSARTQAYKTFDDIDCPTIRESTAATTKSFPGKVARSRQRLHQFHDC